MSGTREFDKARAALNDVSALIEALTRQGQEDMLRVIHQRLCDVQDMAAEAVGLASKRAASAATSIDIFKAFANPVPEGWLWRFEKGSRTCLQTNSVRDGEIHWYLTKEQGGPSDDPAYFLEVEPTAESLTGVLAQAADKWNTNHKYQMLDALMPCIRAVGLK